jgi:hypothetical protein
MSTTQFVGSRRAGIGLEALVMGVSCQFGCICFCNDSAWRSFEGRPDPRIEPGTAAPRRASGVAFTKSDASNQCPGWDDNLSPTAPPDEPEGTAPPTRTVDLAACSGGFTQKEIDRNLELAKTVEGDFGEQESPLKNSRRNSPRPLVRA